MSIGKKQTTMLEKKTQTQTQVPSLRLPVSLTWLLVLLLLSGQNCSFICNQNPLGARKSLFLSMAPSIAQLVVELGGHQLKLRHCLKSESCNLPIFIQYHFNGLATEISSFPITMYEPKLIYRICLHQKV